jgi:hypothetical protein
MFSKLGKRSQTSEKGIHIEDYFMAITFIAGGIDKKEREEYWVRLRIKG